MKLRRMSWAGHVTRMRKISRGYGEFDAKRLRGKPRNSWDFNIKNYRKWLVIG